MNKKNIITLAVLFTTVTLLLIVSQNTSANLLDNEAPFYGNVFEANGACTPSNGTTTVYLTGPGVNLHTTTHTCDGNLPCCYSFGGQLFASGEYILTATDIHGHARMVKVKYNGVPVRKDIYLSAESIY